MRRLADRVMAFLLRVVPWYKPAEIEAREAWTETVRQDSIATRKRAEAQLRSYRDVRLPRHR
jgi:hypothetical protein